MSLGKHDQHALSYMPCVPAPSYHYTIFSMVLLNTRSIINLLQSLPLSSPNSLFFYIPICFLPLNLLDFLKICSVTVRQVRKMFISLCMNNQYVLLLKGNVFYKIIVFLYFVNIVNILILHHS